MTSRCVVLVHAHPDDESLQTGGTMARYAAEGAHVCLITCTNGEVGEVAEVPELGTVDEIQQRLGEIRREELVRACKQLGDIDLRMLGFHDSGMEGTAENQDPQAFVNQDLDAPVRMIVEVLRELRPQVLATYNEYGFYGHPDHIRAHEAALAAIDRAADPSYAPELGEPHTVAKVYYTGMPKSLLRRSAEAFGAEEAIPEEVVERLGTDDELLTTAIDVSRYVPNKFAALVEHRTQLGTTGPWLDMPEDIRVLAFGIEFYQYVRGVIATPTGESDLFEGLEI